MREGRGVIVVAYYTRDTMYEGEAARLAVSLDRCGVPHYMEAFPRIVDWNEATALKPIFLRSCRRRLAGPILYIDADAVMHENCTAYFERLARAGCDFGAHWFQGPAGGYDRTRNDDHLLSGTLFLGDTRGARRLLRVWLECNEQKQAAGDFVGGGQANLVEVLREGVAGELRIEKLPGRYCFVFDKEWAYPEGEPRIIEHTIASRENRGPSAGTVNAARRTRILELEGELCR